MKDPAYPDPNDNEMGYQGPLQCGGSPKSNVFSVSYGQIEVSLFFPQGNVALISYRELYLTSTKSDSATNG
jgi:hypothetical protein